MPGFKKKKKKKHSGARTHARGPGTALSRSPGGLGPRGWTPAAAVFAATPSHTVRSFESAETPVAVARLAQTLPIKQHRIRLKIFAKSALGPKINHSPQRDPVKTDA